MGINAEYMGTHSLSEVKSTMLRSAVLLALVSVAVVAAVNVNTDELAQKAIDEALKLGMVMLDSVMTSFHEDAAKVCYWNDCVHVMAAPRLRRPSTTDA